MMVSDTWTRKHWPPQPEQVEAEARSAYEKHYPGKRWDDLDDMMRALWREWVRANGDLPPR